MAIFRKSIILRFPPTKLYNMNHRRFLRLFHLIKGPFWTSLSIQLNHSVQTKIQQHDNPPFLLNRFWTGKSYKCGLTKSPHAFRRGKDRCMADPLFDLFRNKLYHDFENWLIQLWVHFWSNRRPSVQWYFPLREAWALFVCAHTYRNDFPVFDWSVLYPAPLIEYSDLRYLWGSYRGLCRRS